ncbi:uncharacterized protein LOC111696822 [Eurytemora carolleeae]|uniref:uncharacterized protein LOC111696822 n=1 Tax=Eurytemora carolleeae TaxID=1294199 RepID=UPI000C75EC01|nr:uncharacterized protein LOC111696822 [Eurytemora carolleeae]|eukprot:XP_023322336.1 uncharacterized protein LOC111696822 [Eurytemora affinis]
MELILLCLAVFSTAVNAHVGSGYLGGRGAVLAQSDQQVQNREDARTVLSRLLSIADAVDELEAAEQEAAEARPFMAKPLFRGKKATLQAMWPKQLFKREGEDVSEEGKKINSVVLPWEMKYFSPMLRGK